MYFQHVALMAGSVKQTCTPLIVLQGVESAQTVPDLMQVAAKVELASSSKIDARIECIIMRPPPEWCSRW